MGIAKEQDDAGGGIVLQTDGTPNGDQTLLNLAAGTGINLTDNGTGTVTIDNSAPSTPAGSDKEVQFNDGGSFGADAGFLYNKTDAKVSINGDDSMTVNGAAITTHLQVHASDGVTETEVELHRHGSTAAAGAQLYGGRSRGTEATPTVVQSGDRLMSITAVGFDGTDYATGGQIDFDVSATPGSNDMPTDIIFKTSPNGSQTLTERARIKSDGSVNIGSLTASQIVTTDASKNLQSTSLLPLNLGGTNKNLTASAGGVVWTDADSMEVSAAGTSGQYLKSNGSSAPSWDKPTDTTVLSANLANNAVALSTTNYYTFFGTNAAGTALEPPKQIPSPTAMTLSAFYFRTNSAQSGTGSLVINIRKGAANTGITITIAAGSATGTFTDLSNTASIAAGDLLSIQMINNATAASAQMNGWSIIGTI